MLTPAKFAQASIGELLTAAAGYKVGIDRRWVNAILERPAGEVVAGILEFAASNHEIDNELVPILAYLGSPDALPFYIDYIRRSPADVPDELVDALYPLRREALEPLLALCQELDEEEGGEIAFLLASFRIHDDRVLKLLLDRLEYDAGDGALCLGLYGDPAAKPALERMLTQVDDEHLQQDIKGALAELDRPLEEEPPEPINLDEIFPEHELPETSVLENEELLEMLSAGDPDYRFAAAAGLMNRQLLEQEAEALFDRAKNDPDPKVRAKCWEALSDEMEENAGIREAMLQRLRDESAPLIERQGALVGLGTRSADPPVRAFAESFYQNPETRAAALAAMWMSLDKSFRSFFPPHLTDEDEEVRKQAIAGVGYLGIHDSANQLREMFQDEDFRTNALFAYALCVRAEISPGRMRTLLGKIHELAGGLDEEEQQVVEMALDQRLMLNGQKPVFQRDDEEDEEQPAPSEPAVVKAGRNDPCPCGSGKKYKRCHGA